MPETDISTYDRAEHEARDFSELSDRELLEYIAENMITTDNLLAAIENHIPGMLIALRQKLEEDDVLRTVLKFLPVPKGK